MNNDIPEPPLAVQDRLNNIETQAQRIRRGEIMPLPSLLAQNPDIMHAFMDYLETQLTPSECITLGHELRRAGHGEILMDAFLRFEKASTLGSARADTEIERCMQNLSVALMGLSTQLFVPGITLPKLAAMGMILWYAAKGGAFAIAKNQIQDMHVRARVFKKALLYGPVEK